MSFMTQANYFRASDGFAPPAMGGALGAKFGVLYEADSTRKELFRLPTGAVPLYFVSNVVQAFNGTTVQTMDITHDAGTFADNADISATGQVLTPCIAGSLNMRYDETPVYGIHNDPVATTGTVYVTCVYMLRDE